MKLLRQASVFEAFSRALVESNPAGASSSSSSSSFSVSVFRRSRWDALFLALAVVHGALLVLWPSLWLIGLGMWWNANTISHNFIHSPFFRTKPWNALFSAYLSLLLGVPQTV